jgi:hypothetical protein
MESTIARSAIHLLPVILQESEMTALSPMQAVDQVATTGGNGKRSLWNIAASFCFEREIVPRYRLANGRKRKERPKQGRSVVDWS